MGTRPVRSILALERAEYLGRRAGVRYSRSLVARRTGSIPAASKMRRGIWDEAGALHFGIGEGGVLGAPGRGTVFALVGGEEDGVDPSRFEDEAGKLEPGYRRAAADVEEAGDVVLHQVDGAGGEQRGEGRGADVVFHYADGVGGGGEAEDQLDEIGTAVGQSAGAEDAGSAPRQGAVEVGLAAEFAGEFGDGVGAEGVGGVLLDIGMAGTAIEDVIGGEGDELGVGLAAGEGQVAHG